MAFTTGYNILGTKRQCFGGIHPGMEISMPLFVLIPENRFQDFTDLKKIVGGYRLASMTQSVGLPEIKVDGQETLAASNEELGHNGLDEDWEREQVEIAGLIQAREDESLLWANEMAKEYVCQEITELDDPNSEQSKAYACFISEQSQVSESLKCPMGCGSLKEGSHFRVCKRCHLIIGYQKKYYKLSHQEAQIKLKEWNSKMTGIPEESRPGFTPCFYGDSCDYWDKNACASIDPFTGETKHWGLPVDGGCGRAHFWGVTQIDQETGERKFARLKPGRAQAWVNKYGWEFVPEAELVDWKRPRHPNPLINTPEMMSDTSIPVEKEFFLEEAKVISEP